MNWFFGYAVINDVLEISEPRELDSREEADLVGAWPGLFTQGPFASERQAREEMSKTKLMTRNGRHGTCVDCPRVHGEVYPELCKFTARYDHNLHKPVG